ncbi:hypothetical protein HDV00_004768 [Rhizophlyctis rosea]|nr:hypothetical protein HDV00_004768 [Rhizophlyctis rosea]
MEQLIANIESALSKWSSTRVQTSASSNPTTLPHPPAPSIPSLKALLAPADLETMENDIDEVYRKRLPGTREWLLDDVERWVHDASSRSVFWLVASAGAGKSVVATCVIEKLRSLSILGGFFVCKFSRADRNSPAQLIRTVAFQLAVEYPVVAECIQDLEARKPGFVATANVYRAFQGLLMEPLAKLQSTTPKSFVIVIDALDECGKATSPERKELLQALGNVALPPNVKLFITSRPEPDIREELESVDPYEIVLDEERNRADLLLYAKNRVKRKFPRASDEDNAKRAEDLVEQSRGLFIWLYLAFEELRKTSDVMGTLALLSDGKGGPADQGKDELYSRTLATAFNGIDDEEGWCGKFRDIVGAIIALQASLGREALSGLLGIPEVCIDDTLARIASLLYIADDQIRLIHKSLADFLLHPDRCTDKRFQIDLKACESRVANGCLRSLNYGLRNMCQLDPSLLNSEVSDLEDRMLQNIPRHVLYATIHWIDHFCTATLTPELLSQFDRFLKEHVLNWLEVVSVLGAVPATTIDLLKLDDWVLSDVRSPAKVKSQINTTSLELVHDLSRFIQDFAVPITQSAPHIRISAAPFCPTETALFRMYRHHLNVEVKGRADLYWSACVRTFEGHEDVVTCLAVTSDGKALATGSRDGRAKIWNLQGGDLVQGWENTQEVVSIAITEDGAWSVIAVKRSNDVKGIAEILDNRRGKVVYVLRDAEEYFERVAITSDGQAVITCGGIFAKVWDASTGSLLRTFESHVLRKPWVCTSGQVTTWSVQDIDWLGHVWDPREGKVLHTLEGGDEFNTFGALTPDSRYLVTMAHHYATLWDTQVGTRLHQLEGHSDYVRCCAISADGRTIVTGAENGVLLVWDAENGKSRQTLRGHVGPVLSAVMFAEGRKVITSSHDGTAKVWDLQMTKRTQVFEGHSATVLCLAATPDGCTIATGSLDGTVRMGRSEWHTSTKSYLEKHCRFKKLLLQRAQ